MLSNLSLLAPQLGAHQAFDSDLEISMFIIGRGYQPISPYFRERLIEGFFPTSCHDYQIPMVSARRSYLQALHRAVLHTDLETRVNAANSILQVLL